MCTLENDVRYRRVVTNVKNKIESDKILDITVEYDDGHKITEIWTTNSSPNLEDKHHEKEEFSLSLAPGQTRFATCTIPPLSTLTSKQINENSSKYGMHSTQTIDYIIVFDGEVELHLENETVLLKRGDTVVQRGAIHAWHNKTNTPAEIIAVMIGAKEHPLFSQRNFVQVQKKS